MVKLLGNNVNYADNAGNGILGNKTVAVPLKYLRSFRYYSKCHWLIAKYNKNVDGQSIVLSAAINDNANGNNDVLFLLLKTKNYMFLY